MNPLDWPALQRVAYHVEHGDLDKARHELGPIMDRAGHDQARVDSPASLPRSLHQALNHYVFPNLRVNARPLSSISPVARTSTDSAPMLGAPGTNQRIRDVHDPNLLRHVNSCGPTLAAADETSPALRDWCRRYAGSYEALQRSPVAYEDDISAVALPFFWRTRSTRLPLTPQCTSRVLPRAHLPSGSGHASRRRWVLPTGFVAVETNMSPLWSGSGRTS